MHSCLGARPPWQLGRRGGLSLRGFGRPPPAGRVTLSCAPGAAEPLRKDSDLARFIKRVRNYPNARFILTTRAYIFEEARRVSEHLADRSLDIAKYVLDVGVYTRRIRARILYNHLLVAGPSQAHITSWSKADTSRRSSITRTTIRGSSTG